jgi:aspartate kinase
MKVIKFGGTSLATADQIKKACSIILSDEERRLIVVSAPGKRFKEDTKVTDLLIKFAKNHIRNGNDEGIITEIVERYSEIADGLGLKGDIVDRIKEDIYSRVPKQIDNKNKFIDSMKAAGEDNAAKIFAEYLKSLGVQAKYINPKDAGLMLSDEFGNARVLPESYDNLKKLKEMAGILVFPGFFGYSSKGEVVTFPRGGSDITGSILAVAINAEVYENFTDVDSVFAADPNVVHNPKAISNITYREMRELSYGGFSVLHEETLEPVYRTNIPVNIKNTNNPEASGTLISTNREITNGPVVGISSDDGFCCLFVGKYMLNREVGFGRKILQFLEEENLAYEHMPSGIDSISIILRERQFTKEKEGRLMEKLKRELALDDISLKRNLTLIMIVGEGMFNAVGVAARAIGSIAKAKINIEMINQGSSEISMMFSVKSTDEKNAVRALYNEFFN